MNHNEEKDYNKLFKIFDDNYLNNVERVKCLINGNLKLTDKEKHELSIYLLSTIKM